MALLPGRVTHVLTALLTVFCLGCESFDSLLDALVHRAGSAQVSCMTMSADDSGTPDASAVTAVSASCGCDHCAAVQVAPPPPPIVPLPTPTEVVAVLGSALTVARPPLVPPPVV